MALEELQSRVSRKIAGMHLILEVAGKDLQGKAQASASWTDRTGATRAGIEGGAEGGGTKHTIYLQHSTKVGMYLEEGTGIYGPKGTPIKAKGGKALHFKNDKGEAVFAREVKGIKAMPTVKPTMEKSWPTIKGQLERYFNDTI